MASSPPLRGTPIRSPEPPAFTAVKATPPPKPKPVSTPRVPSATVSRNSVAAAQAAAVPSAASPKIFQPWVHAITIAEQRMRGRLALALADLEHHMAQAGGLLDTAEQAAKEAESQILAAAWHRWHQDLDAAADAAAAVMDPARKAYAQLVAAAGREYDTAIADARTVYEAELSRAQSAAQLAESMPAPASAKAAG